MPSFSDRYWPRATSPLLFALAFIACESGTNQGAPARAVSSTMGIDPSDANAWAAARGLEIREYDLNRDNRPNVFKFVRIDADAGEILQRKDVDLNNDGTIDIVQLYDDDGELSSEQSDLDFDGRIDVISYYERAVLVKKQLDIDYDGRADITRFYTDGQIERMESDTNGDGRIDTWEYFVRGELERVGTDTNGDGLVDHWDRRSSRRPPNPTGRPNR